MHALVLELVEGPTLADRIAQGAMPLDEALPIARQIAEALDAAHEHGIIHRDLKPANVKLRPDGTVKVLDFGLAKTLERGPAGSSMSMSPTLTSPAATGIGMILGTAAYMSPEQARGKIVDKRSDIWSFGCVLYEMLTGRRPFEGEDVTEVLARVLEREPNLTAFPGPGRAVRVSTSGGVAPLWRADGREIFYFDGNQLMAAPVAPQRTGLDVSAPVMLFTAPAGRRAYDVSRDGRFLIDVSLDGEPNPPITILLNWAGARRRENRPDSLP